MGAVFDFAESDIDADLRRDSIEQRRHAHRMFAWCNECMSHGHRNGCPEALQPEEAETTGDEQ